MPLVQLGHYGTARPSLDALPEQRHVVPHQRPRLSIVAQLLKLPCGHWTTLAQNVRCDIHCPDWPGHCGVPLPFPLLSTVVRLAVQPLYGKPKQYATSSPAYADPLLCSLDPGSLGRIGLWSGNGSKTGEPDRIASLMSNPLGLYSQGRSARSVSSRSSVDVGHSGTSLMLRVTRPLRLL